MHIPLLQSSGLFEIEWHSLLLGDGKWNFLPEVALRTFFMFFVILTSLRILGKRSVAQLSVFELGVIIGLGSAAGDPMFYKDVGLLPGVVVFAVVLSLYRLITFFINKSEKVERLLEGKPAYLVGEGKIITDNFENEAIARDEFFAQLRQHSITHLGQVKQAIIETNGAVSLFYFTEEESKWGLPILPHLCEKTFRQVTAPGQYACNYCGQVQEIAVPAPSFSCSSCRKDVWVKAINERRIV